MSHCVNCGKPAEEAKHCITGGTHLYEDEGEWVCSDECHAAIIKERDEDTTPHRGEEIEDAAR